jgi:hypothetical protein
VVVSVVDALSQIAAVSVEVLKVLIAVRHDHFRAEMKAEVIDRNRIDQQVPRDFEALVLARLDPARLDPAKLLPVVLAVNVLGKNPVGKQKLQNPERVLVRTKRLLPC